MFKKIHITMTARRLGLRDKGEVRPRFEEIKRTADDSSLPSGMPRFDAMMASVEGGVWKVEVCKHCKEPARIGAMKDGTGTMYWCWRCEWKEPINLTSKEVGDDDDPFLKNHGLRF